MPRLLLISNRLPVTLRKGKGRVTVEPSVGGLATGLRGPHQSSGGLWIGWPGDVSRLDPADRSDVAEQLAALRTVPIDLTPKELKRYYEGLSNSALWPLFHYLLDKVEMSARDWASYVKVNERFARVTAEQYRPGDLIWVHDYQLCLVPGMLRERLPDARIGFFLHIPFPSSEVFRILPWRREILQGLLGADLIGFHTFSYMRHFASSALRLLGLDTAIDRIVYSGREVRLGVFPIGIDAAGFEELAGDPDIVADAAAIRDESRDQRLLVGVDRLDYTKGIPNRLLAMERILAREPSLRGKVRLVQIATPSRTQVEAYGAFRREVDELVGRINSAYGSVASVPLHYLSRTLPQRKLVPLYLAADVMLVTPLRDGMNLVAKEFIASRIDDDGVLILSEFAGAASELGEALLVNPYDTEQMATAIQRAIQMAPHERRARMKALRRRVFTMDIHHWAESFLRSLEESDSRSTRRVMPITPEPVLAQLAERVRRADRLVLLMGYDGTLVPFAEVPVLASPDPELIALLRTLADRPGTTLHVISGRSRETLGEFLGHLPIGLHAEHGLWSLPAGSTEWRQARDIPERWDEKVRPILEEFSARTPGSFLEDKSGSLAWHYRSADVAFGANQARELRLHLSQLLHNMPIEVIQGKRVLELRLRGIHKGLVARSILEETEKPFEVIAMGDDRTDDDLFAALPEHGIAVHVGPSGAPRDYCVADPTAARALLLKIAS